MIGEIRNVHGINVKIVRDRENGCEECIFNGYCERAANHTEEACGEEQIGRNCHFEKVEQ